MTRDQQTVVAYLLAQNEIPREQLRGRRVRFSDAQRRKLVRAAKALGPQGLSELDTLVTPDTPLRWYRRLIAKKYDGNRAVEGTSRSPRSHGDPHLVAFIADGDRSEPVVTTLRDLNAQAGEARLAIARLEAEVGKPVALPSPDEMRERLDGLEATIREDPTRGREALRTYFRGGSIIMTPFPDEKAYEANAELLPLVLLLSEPDEAKTPPGVAGRRRYTPVGCGGPVRRLDNLFQRAG